jgi:DinB superfamily
MKLTFRCAVVIMLFVALTPVLRAQNTPGAQAAASPQPPRTFASVVESEINGVEREFVEAGEAMPEDKFNFTPAALGLKGSEYNGVKTFAEEVRHVAATNFWFWAPIVGEKPPMDLGGDNGPESLKTKAEIIKFLKDSFAFGHRAAKSITQENVLETVPAPYNPKQQVTRLYLASFAVWHAFDHYGQMVEYLRMNGIIPPASRPRPKQ